MASQKEVKSRIASIKNINKITRAMEMVAAARLRRSEQRIADLRPYSEGMRAAARVREEGAEPVFSVVGRKGVSALTFRKQELAGEYVGFTDRPAFSDAREIGEALTAQYVDEDVDRVEMIYNRFVSPLTQHVWRQTLLPLQQAEVVGEGAEEEEEPEEET